MIDPNELERLSNPREALEEAWEHLCQTSLSFRRYACTTIPGGDGWTMTGRFCRFLDAEAWTDAALMLIPDNWTAWEMRSHAGRSHFSADLSRLSECDAGQEDWAHGRGMHPALALAEAALRAKEAGNG